MSAVHRGRVDTHVDEKAGVAYLSGGIDDEGAERLERHIDGCASCRGLVEGLAAAMQRDTAAQAPAALQPAAKVEPPVPGDVIDGKFRIVSVLGQGGMGAVYKAEHIQLNHMVALKFMLPKLTTNPVAARRFLREARAVVRLETPYVARVFDLGTLPNGAAYLVMEYLEGETVHALLQRRRRLEPREALQLVREAALGLEVAHQAGIVHRDIKPQNLFLVRARGPDAAHVKVLDFGVARSHNPAIEQGLGTISSTALLVGSPLYMAPEQLSGVRQAPSIDVWALGVVLYELVTGRPPFVSDSLVGLAHAIRNVAHTDVSVPRADSTGPALARIVDKCLAKDPGARFGSVSALRKAIDAALDSDSGSVGRAASSRAAPNGRRPVALVVALTALSFALAGGALVLARAPARSGGTPAIEFFPSTKAAPVPSTPAPKGKGRAR